MEERNYTADNINVLEGLDAIRKRPGMYIGDVGTKGLHHCVYEVVDNSIDEAVAGHCDTIDITYFSDGYIEVKDNGRGIPTEEKDGVSAATISVTVLHAGGKFDKDTYQTSGGLHGIGTKAVNATSEHMMLTIHRNGEIHHQEFNEGIQQDKMKVIGSTKKRGTIFKFKPDSKIFDSTEYDVEILKERFKQSAYLTKTITINLNIEEHTFQGEIRPAEKIVFHSENGISDFVDNLKNDSVIQNVQFEGSDEKRGEVFDSITGKKDDNGIIEKIDLDVAFTYESGSQQKIYSFVNKINTPEGGVHEQGVIKALSAALIKKIKSTPAKTKKDQNIIDELNIEDVKEGLTMIVSIAVYTDIVFEGQTKSKLSGKHIESMVRAISKKEIEEWIAKNPKEMQKLSKKIILARKARKAGERARELAVSTKDEEVAGMLGKLSDCQSKNPEERELFLVEGDSAGGCIFAETPINTASGKVFTIKEIAEKHEKGEDVFVYTYNHKTEKIELQKISNAWKTKTTSDLVKVYLDNGEEIICTPDHPFLLRNGDYIPAKDLKAGNSLMPIYLKYSYSKNSRRALDGYEIVTHPNGEESYTHILADEYNLKNKLDNFKQNKNRFVRHHVDFNKKNNNPSNIRRMDWYEHRELHNKNVEKTLHTPEARAKTKKTMATSESKAKRSKISKEQWKDKNYTAKFPQEHHKKMRSIQLEKGINVGFGSYWEKEENKKAQSIRIKKHFEDNPEKREELRIKAKKQWDDEALKKWRSQKNKRANV
jgi:DNA gyrase subunit B